MTGLVSEQLKDFAAGKHNVRPMAGRKLTGGRVLLLTHPNYQTTPTGKTTPPFVRRRREQRVASEKLKQGAGKCRADLQS